VDIEPAHRLAVGLDLDHRIFADTVELGLAPSRNRTDDGAHFPREPFQFIVAVPEDLADEVGAGTGHDLVEPHLDGLGHEDALTGHLIEERLAHDLAEPFLGDGPAVFLAPLVARIEHQVGVRDVGIHRIAGHLGGADAREDFLHLGKVAADDGFALLLQFRDEESPALLLRMS